MTNNNGDKRKKKCPFLNDWCIEKNCALYTEMIRKMGNLEQRVGACALTAMVELLSGINAKTQQPQQKKILLP